MLADADQSSPDKSSMVNSAGMIALKESHRGRQVVRREKGGSLVEVASMRSKAASPSQEVSTETATGLVGCGWGVAVTRRLIIRGDFNYLMSLRSLYMCIWAGYE